MNLKYSSKLLHFRIQMRFKLEQVSSETCNVFRVIIILYTIDPYVVRIPQNECKWNKIVLIQTMSNPKILCLPPVANTLRDLDMRFTWVMQVKWATYTLGLKTLKLFLSETRRHRVLIIDMKHHLVNIFYVCSYYGQFQTEVSDALLVIAAIIIRF